MLKPAYKQALEAMKDQAKAATALLNGKDTVQAGILRNAQARMALCDAECKHIAELLRSSEDPNLSIDTLDEARLAFELAQ